MPHLETKQRYLEIYFKTLFLHFCNLLLYDDKFVGTYEIFVIIYVWELSDNQDKRCLQKPSQF